MRQAVFVERRSATWERLEDLIRRVGRRGVRALDASEIVELGRLYRATTSDLAYAGGRGFDRALIEYLNRLTARAHAHVYGGSIARRFRKSFAGHSRILRSAPPLRSRAASWPTPLSAPTRRKPTHCFQKR